MTDCLSVYFDTCYGSSQDYAEHLAKRCGTTAIACDDAGNVAQSGGPVVVVSPNYGGLIAGARFIKNHDFGQRPVGLVIVGMSQRADAERLDPGRRALGSLASHVTRFYVPGRLTYSGLSHIHKTALWSLKNLLLGKPHRSPSEQSIIDTYGKDVDAVDYSRLDEVVDWIGAHCE